MFWRVFTLHLSLLLTFTMHLCHFVAGVRPVIGRRGFSVVWNMPTSRCERRYGVLLPLEKYGIIHNAEQKFLGKNFSGLAVLDWEAWQPLWRQNFGKRKVYKKLSKLFVRQRYSEMSEEDVTSLAKVEFEQAARAFMEETLRLGTRVRPRGLWGFYGFPGCYNNRGAKQNKYTGKCKPGTETMNNRLGFLWQHSTALFPSLYVKRELAGHPNTQLMMRHRTLEALRVASQHASHSQPIPVLSYARVAFRHTLQFLNQTDLEHTLGESAALGAAGVVLWGELSFSKSKDQCILLRDYINSVLGVYVKTLQRGVMHCSERVCHGNGRCARRNPHSAHTIVKLHNKHVTDRELRAQFKCMCYEGSSGPRCENTVTRV